ncbi:ThuA domain-containing protein [Cryobacterium adonitolivorans]|uniref:ThuA domain-containing protein n=1 Tax=Cryobacterium adonitolivorans TaxID=1259189 RepID=A0A4R8W543_9MICO|nr:ThuA domain-containing protein [Cryobacterium adonitolivorans]TFC02423.1 ThuA domain-containing protein [Cryobacterium adonitolivorans]
MKALIVRGGWDGHRPVESTELFVPFLRDHGYEVRIEESPAVYADDRVMAGTDLIVQSVTMSEITADQVAGLRDAVAAGAGLTGWHGGIADSYRASADYLQLVGGQFVTHPAKAPELREGGEEDNYLEHLVTVTAEGRTHPVTVGLADFSLTTEQYWVLHDDLCDVLATTTHPARAWQPWHRPLTSPAVWTRRWGNGRIVVTTPGHSLDVLQDPSVRTIIERGMLWATRTQTEQGA